MGPADTQGVGSYLCMHHQSWIWRIMDCFGLEWTLKPSCSSPVCPHRHTPGWAIIEFYLTWAQPLEASLGVSSDVVGQGHSSHVQNPALRGSVCPAQPGRPQQSPRVLCVPPALPPWQALPAPGTCTSHRECWIPSTPKSPHTPNPLPVLERRRAVVPCTGLGPKSVKLKLQT